MVGQGVREAPISAFESASEASRARIARDPGDPRSLSSHAISAIAYRDVAELLGTVIDVVPANLAILDPDGTVTQVNDRWRRFALENGYDGADFGIGRNYLEICAAAPSVADPVPAIGERLKAVLEGRSQSFTDDYPCNSPSERRQFRMIAAAIHQRRGGGAIVMHFDVTGEHLAAGVLAAERELLSLVASDRPLDEVLLNLCESVETKTIGAICAVTVFESKAPSIRVVARPGFPDALRQLLDGRPLAGLECPCAEAACGNAEVLLADASIWGKWPRFQEAMLDAGYRACWSVPISSPDGKVMAVFEIYRPVDGSLDDRLTRFIRRAANIAGIAIDRKRAAETLRANEERLRAIASNIPGALYERIVRSDGKVEIVYLSDRYLELTGYTPEEARANPDRVLEEVLGKEGRQTLASMSKAAISTMSPVDLILPARKKSGEAIWIRTIARPRRVQEGTIAWDGVLLDVTAQHEAERQRELLEQQLMQSQKAEALGTLAGGIAHDINNTLVPIIGLTEMALEDAPADGELQSNLSGIMRAATRIQDLVRQILAFSRHDLPVREAVDLRETFGDSWRLLKPMIPATIRVDIDVGQEPLIAVVDATQMHQTIMNLLSNAVAAFEGASGTIEIRMSRAPSSPGSPLPAGLEARPYAILSVADSGKGIDPAVLGRIFDPFFTTKPVGEGTGLGLSVIQGIVRAHSGLITVESTLGKGTCFNVYLPLTGGAGDRKGDADRGPRSE